MYLLGYDLGTSSVKAALVDAATGTCVASDFYPKTEAPIKALNPGWAEQCPEDWVHYLKEATSSVLESSGVDPADIKAIGFSYQMHGLVAIDRDGHLLRDAIIWCDSRGVPYGEQACDELGADLCMPRLLNRPGNFTATKLQWVRRNEPHIFEKIYKVMLPADYIAYRLTGEICTNPEGLSEYMLWDFSTGAPATFLMDYLGYPHDIFPTVRPTFCEQGRVTAKAAAEFGLAEGTPVTYRAGDQPNNALSLNVFNPGEVASTAGTSGVVYGINDTVDYDPRSRVNNFAHVNHSDTQTRIGVMTCISGTGILNSWCKRNIAPQGYSYSEINRLAATAPVGSAGITILPFGNGAERVLENREPGCSIHGINFNTHGRSHLLRAAQEGIVFSFMYGMEIMESIGMEIKKIHAGRANMFLSPVFRETLASVSGATIDLFDTDGATGAAKGAGIGAGIYKSTDEAFASLVKLDEIHPAVDRTPYLEAYARWKKVLADNLDI
ncbi:MAG: FGGY family carbohydrate kinase [Bacteroides sp.]|nr:FGGY family carbohydrate kinase [Bacteroides sp.]MCM1096147.1 FGGY family carbohydrate kinase [Terasakiella sp.]